ncbi:MAG TPA: hypothetical protein PKK48_10195, partial [Phycisphaerae bacterium]|nr:hypothetical protein [Phycisphaerae bacterium]
AYRKKVSRSFLIGPKFAGEKTLADRLGPHGEVLYCRADGKIGGEYEKIIRPVEERYGCEIDFGRRLIIEPYSGKNVLIDVILVDVSVVNIERLNTFKGRLFEKFGVTSDRFENIWEYEQYVRLAEPACDTLRALINGARNPVVILGHEFMGMPTVLKAKLDMPESRAYFHAHEVASVRPVVEKRSGHDTMFYNVMSAARRKGLTLEEVFDEVAVNFKHRLVKAAKYCDGVLAVGDFVREELEFMSSDFTESNVHLVYNGIPSNHITLDDKIRSRTMLCDYARKLLGYCPRWVFTHVARPVLSKGIWRDLRVMHELDAMLQQRGETAVYFMLGTLGGVRRPSDVMRMEKDYDWPVTHRLGYPDL